jgi:hypothetical protein
MIFERGAKMDFVDFRSFARSDQLHSWLFDKAAKYVDDKDVVGFYCTNFLYRNGSSTLYLFTKKDIWIFTYENQEYRIRRIADYVVNDIELMKHTNDRYYGTKLNISLVNGQTLHFDAAVDSNDTWRDDFSTIVENIYNELIKAP